MKYVVNDFHYATAMTHGGKFHADDVISTVILKKIYGDSFKLIRTFRVPNDLPSNVIVYDIGGGALDHHQKGGNGVRKNGVPYSMDLCQVFRHIFLRIFIHFFKLRLRNCYKY